jgi:thiol-disulfide isomerase/thioredoxin
MTIASVLLALLTATTSPAGDSTGPVLLDFHSQSCGPCRKARPAVELLIRNGYAIKTIDIEQEPAVAKRYDVTVVPTFIMVDPSGRELDRTTGLQSAAQLAQFYKAAVARAQPPANSNAHVNSRPKAGASADDEEADPTDGQAKAGASRDDDERGNDRDPPAPAATNPKPWETVVRIRVMNNRSIGFGSGTIIHSTPDESLILTCAHIFKLDRGKQVPPSQFPRKILIDLFDGNLQGTQPATVHFVEAVPGWAVDYDFTRDVGLIRIKPGRRLPACRVVPAHWVPESRMRVLTVGCSEGHDATAWHTMITKARIQNFLSGNPAYEAIECNFAPKQGRSGGGLFTDDGYIAGVCNFAEPQGDHGLYATPRSIYHMLDRNNLMALYAPVSRGSGTLMADGRAGAGARRGRTVPVSVARSQSPDHEEPGNSRGRGDDDELTVPHPSLLGIAEPVTRQARSSPQVAARTTKRTAWQPHAMDEPAGARRTRNADDAEPTDLNLDAAADQDRFGPAPDDAAPDDAAPGDRDGDPAVAPSPSKAAATTGPRWRAVKIPADN